MATTFTTGDTTVARTILDQMGGTLFVRMTGAKQLTAYPKALGFRLPGGGFTKSGINYVVVTLNGLDLYDVEFARISRKRKGWVPAVTLIHTETNIYADKLAEVFRLHTGLRTRF